ncbi:penicillin-binding transpeptidase domain-containing protein [Dethiothermospora halolimnae]|uniref:penicillin-binding transpeptidase domain-containing protein n=1 Tax=Dethiothermospora halolimnae TaxID=3114390 RepID=UPI003CCBDE29
MKKLIEKLKDRYNILTIIICFIVLLLSFRLATLTIVHGDELRKKSDTKRLKQVSITAPRGEIRDRYGRLLATNKPSFTVQLLKDELSNESEERNQILLELMSILEDNNESYVDQFPIVFNIFQYKDKEKYIQNDALPEEIVIKTIIDNKLIGQLFNIFYNYKDGEHNFSYIAADKGKLILEKEGIEVPINIRLENNQVNIEFSKNKDIDLWKKEMKIDEKLSAKDTLTYLISKDNKNIRKLMSSPIFRKLAFEFLKGNGYIDDLKLTEYAFRYDVDYITKKVELIKSLPNIGVTLESDAKDDFINIVLNTSINKLISGVFESENGEIIPGQSLITKLKEKEIDLPIIYEIDHDNNKLKFKYESEKSKVQFLKRENLNQESKAVDALISVGEKYNLIQEVIFEKDIKYIAQRETLNFINPEISVKEGVEYTTMVNKKNWLKQRGISDVKNAKETFRKVMEKENINENLSRYEVRHVLTAKEQLRKQIYKAYEPITISYGIRETTVAEIEEKNLELKGVKVSIEPVRYYPMGDLASHSLGYMGKIATESEINKYLRNRKNYSPDDLIGKTGLEQKFEEYLKGVDGKKKVEVDALGNTTKVFSEEKAKPGNNLFLTIDANLQKKAEELLEYGLKEIQKGGVYQSKWGDYDYRDTFENATTGSLVAIDVKTGEVLAMANYPSYDPNLFSTGISYADYEGLKPKNEEDPLAPRPLYNVAMKTAVQPGSIFKMITALAGLEKGIDPYAKLLTRGFIELGNRTFGCWIWNDRGGTHGYENMFEAIRDSCNYYFYTITTNPGERRTGKNLGPAVTLQDILDLSKKFGLDEITGIEVPGEGIRGVPNPETKIRISKRRLKGYLKENLQYYIKENIDMDDKELNKKIEEITSWVGLNTTLSRAEVIKGLDELGFDGLRKLEGKNTPLVDVIKYTYLNYSGWKQGDTLNVSIGQGQNAYTPLQMARYIATLANGGYKNTVSIVKKVESYNGGKITFEPETESKRIQLNNYENLDYIKKGMLMVTGQGGSAYGAFKDFPVKVGAKTGTAQNLSMNPITGEEYDPYAWFVAFAPYDDPQIAVSAIIFQGGHGGYAGPMVRDVIAEYLGLNNQYENITFGNKLIR